MVTIQETDLKEGIMLAVSRASALGRPILVSEVHKIEAIEPLSFYHKGKNRYFGERFFWKDPSNEAFIIGIGIATQIQSDQDTDRFFHVGEKWKRFVSEAIVYNPNEVIGVGPLIFGGFSFDPLKQKTNLWSKFAHAQFHLPKYMLSIIDGKTFLTTNVLCTRHDDDSLFQKVIEERNLLLQAVQPAVPMVNIQLADTEEIAPEEWKKSVAKVVGDLQTGPLKKVVLARELRLKFEEAVESESVLAHLRKEQAESFIFALETNGDCFLGASPERLVKKKGNEVFSTCLAGSIRRGKTEQEDIEFGEQLLRDEKNLIEHRYVVDMIKEALEKRCEFVHLPDNPQLMKIRDIQHLYTPVTGLIHQEASLLTLVDDLHPTPALGGLPKREAVEKIREVEILDRGYYAAPVGWLDYRDNGEFAVAIRSALIKGKEASLFAGCGVVADSVPESEYLETRLKFRPMLTALGGKYS